ncbi:protein lin-37 homolog isoform X2 [Grus americana]|uniref:Protein lin-37 n=1 Tax=Grus japonensis TaxID=30415 RepID=A0ABC9XSQ3_GRUJA|nr:protein lin-37 homolog isoform X2 [Grus americana]
MLAVKVKVEKPDLEAASARSRLDAVLQGLLERSQGPREQMEEEAGKAPGDAHSKEASPSAPGKRPSGRFSQQRRKKRREAEEGLPDPAQQRHNTYVIKLFDRSVELGQFPEGTPLYPVCRAWMRNCPTARGGGAAPQLPQHPTAPPRPEGAAGHAGKGEDIYELPPPAPPGPPRIPSPLGPEEGAPPPDQLPDPAPSMSSLIYKNMERWKRVRQRWQEAGQRQQQRYGPSLRLLRLIYERQ